MEDKEKMIMHKLFEAQVELAKKTDEEIQKIVNDIVEVKKSSGKPPTYQEYFAIYDNVTISLIHGILNIREEKTKKDIRSGKAS